MDEISQFIPYLIPILALQLLLMVAALIDLGRREHTRGPKWVWLLVIILVNLIGPVIYFMYGREE